MNTYAQSLLAKHDQRMKRISGRWLRLNTGDGVNVISDNGYGEVLVKEYDGNIRAWGKAEFIKTHLPCQ